MLGKIKQYIKKSAMPVLYWSGVSWAYSLMSQTQGAVILMYHSVAGAKEAEAIDPANRITPFLFEKQMEFLARHRRVISMSDLVTAVDAGKEMLAGTVVLTFDDGYLDNLTVAAPILAHYSLPATLFLATGYVGRSEPQWADVLHWLFAKRSNDICIWPIQNGTNIEQRVFDLGIERDYRALRKILHQSLLQAGYAERKQDLNELESQLKPSLAIPRLTLNWEEVRLLQKHYPLFELGGHTCNHVDLSCHSNEVVETEIKSCAADLKRELGLEKGHFSFPYGRSNPFSRKFVRESGWKSAIASGHRVRIDKRSEAHSLSRGETPRSLGTLGFMTGSAYPGLYPDLLSIRGSHVG